jgi:hypothetical protein
MSGPTLTTFFDERRGKWRLLWGGETFYDESRKLVEFETEQEILDWWADCPQISGMEITTQEDQCS